MHFAPIAIAIALVAAQSALSAPAVGFSPNGGVPAQRRDLQELEARTSISDLIRQINEGVRTSNHIINVNQRSQELEARASVSELMRQAAEQMRNNNHIMTPASLGVFQRSIDESGALSLKSLLTTITKIIPGIGKTTEAALKGVSKIPKRSEPSAREFMDVLARALEARELNELD